MKNNPIRRACFLLFFTGIFFLCMPVHRAMAQSAGAEADTAYYDDEAWDSAAADSDTSLLKERNPAETVYDWKSKREFSYMLYLDSLLRKHTDLKSDTVSIDRETGKINRRHRAATGKGISGINSVLNSFPVQVFFWISAIAFILLIAYRVFVKSGLLKKTERTAPADQDEETPTELAAVERYNAFIQEAERKSQFNLAVRWQYLKILKLLTEKEYIDFTAEKTNKDYMHEMAVHPLAAEFGSLTRLYEYAWYGRGAMDAGVYESARGSFNAFIEKI